MSSSSTAFESSPTNGATMLPSSSDAKARPMPSLPEVARALRSLAPARVALDGEGLIALDDNGRPSFNACRGACTEALHRARRQLPGPKSQ